MMIFAGIIIGLLVGVIVGFYFAICCTTENEKKATKDGIAKLNGKYYKLTEIDGGKV